MDHAVTAAAGPVRGTFCVPPSKSIHQRALALAALSDGTVAIHPAEGLAESGDDVRRTAAALAALGRWEDGALGAGRASHTLDMGENGTGFRFAAALATLRPAGARTLVRGRPALMRRPHRVLLRALGRLGAHVKRRSSGAVRVLGGGVRGDGRTLPVDITRSSQYASALLLLAPRIGGLTVELPPGAPSRAYVRVTEGVLQAFGVPVEATDTHVRVAACAPRAASFTVEADASAAACWRVAAALTGGEARIPGLPDDSRQPDAAVGALLRARSRPGDVTLDLRDCSDLVFLAGVLAAVAEGETRITGVAHTRRKESDRLRVLVAGLRAMGADAALDTTDESVRVRGARALRGARIDCAGDHRAAIAFGVLGLHVPGVVLGGAECVAKSQPGFLADLERAAQAT